MRDRSLKICRLAVPALCLWAANAPDIRAGAPRAPEATRQAQGETIRVEIFNEIQKIQIELESPGSVTDLDSGETRRLTPNQVYEVEPAGLGQIHFDNWILGSHLRVSGENPQKPIWLGGRPYRGSLKLRSASSKWLNIVNELDVEDYLNGVLAKEMGENWPMEALKAQAVVSRSYALRALKRSSNNSFDLGSDTRFQVYDGTPRTEKIERAVRETAGEVLTYKGDLLPAYFHSCCGGHTSSAKTIWPDSEPVPAPLSGVADRYCRLSPHYGWKVFLPLPAILSALKPDYPEVNKIYSLRVIQRAASGYVRWIRIKTDAGMLDLLGNRFRQILGSDQIKSAYITRLFSYQNGFAILGRGWGHGVGMCQWGAKAQAEKGKSYKSILRFYFRGAAIDHRANL